jgi:hypothetical protein
MKGGGGREDISESISLPPLLLGLLLLFLIQFISGAANPGNRLFMKGGRAMFIQFMSGGMPPNMSGAPISILFSPWLKFM